MKIIAWGADGGEASVSPRPPVEFLTDVDTTIPHRRRQRRRNCSRFRASRLAIEGEGWIALLGGEAGIGKTALLQELAKASLGARVSEPAVKQLARKAGQASSDLYRVTGGNPFFVTEALAAVADTVPGQRARRVLTRAMRLAPEARRIAELASVVPGRTES
jgi:hypothetical protein